MIITIVLLKLEKIVVILRYIFETKLFMTPLGLPVAFNNIALRYGVLTLKGLLKTSKKRLKKLKRFPGIL